MSNIREFERLALQLAPASWQTSNLAPDTWEKTQASFAPAGIVTVWSGASNATVYSSPRANWLFRAWHDSMHLAYGLDFSLAGEERACERQTAQVYKVCSDRAKRRFASALLEIEIVEQAKHAVVTGEFIQDQLAFTLLQLKQRRLSL